MNPSHTQIIIIGAALVFGLPICVGLVVGYFFGLWPGILSGGLLCLAVAYMGHRQLVKTAREQGKKDEDGRT